MFESLRCRILFVDVRAQYFMQSFSFASESSSCCPSVQFHAGSVWCYSVPPHTKTTDGREYHDICRFKTFLNMHFLFDWIHLIKTFWCYYRRNIGAFTTDIRLVRLAHKNTNNHYQSGRMVFCSRHHYVLQLRCMSNATKSSSNVPPSGM